MANYPIEDIEGIGEAFGRKLRDAGISDTDTLLERGRTAKGRTEIENATGLAHAHVLRWVNMADLYRVKGVGSEYAELLEASGVDTVRELATRVPANLHKKMSEVNAQKNLVRSLPNEASVASWVAHAKELPAMVEH